MTCAPLELITRKEFMQRLGYRSLCGFENHLARDPTCPRPFRFTNSGSARVFFSRQEVEAYLSGKAGAAQEIMPGDRNVVI